MTKRNLLVLTGVFTLILVLCASFSTRAIELYQKMSEAQMAELPIKNGPIPDWVDKMMHNPVCELPCWENITPGETPIQEVPTLLSQVDYVSSVSGPEQFSQSNPHVHAEFLVADLSQNSMYLCMLHASTGESVVQELEMRLYGSEITNVNVGEMVAVYGEPEYVQVYWCDRGICNFRMIYPTKGLVLNIELRDFGNKAQVKPESSVAVIILIPTGLQSYWDNLLWPSPNTHDPLIPWQGYGEYTEGGEFTPYDKKNPRPVGMTLGTLSRR